MITGTVVSLSKPPSTRKPHNPPMEIEQGVSVLDHEAFAAKHMPNLGHDVEDFQVFHWKILDWYKLAKGLTSPEFDCGGHKWRILLYPFGNPNSPPCDIVSVYLSSANPEGMEKGWHACAQFTLAISNPYDPTVYTVNHAYHRFIAEVPDWGFIHFSELPKLLYLQPDHDRPRIEGGSAMVSAYVKVLLDPTGALRCDIVEYDSKKQTGYVGLRNQGATSCLNAALQLLFHIRYFRKAIYRIPTEDYPTRSISLALQRVFYNLQTSDQPVDTAELKKSFGWQYFSSFLAQDVHGFNRAFRDRLEFWMGGTGAEGAIPKLFRGKMKIFIKRVNVNLKGYRIEEFDDIRLEVRGMKTLYDSFRDYVAVATLDGENKYQAGGFGPQDAWKGITFQSFPQVLNLQLKRYEFGAQRGVVTKINDRFEFPFEIDLDQFLDETADRTKPWKYKLHGVLVHSSGTHDGHYFAFIKPDQHARWLKFDDERVTPVTDQEVLEVSYGGEPPNDVVPQSQRNQVGAMKRVTNAYTLVYIREIAIDEVMEPLTEEDTPQLQRRLIEERARRGAVMKEKVERHLFLTAKVITDETFSRHEGFDLAVFDGSNLPPCDLPTFRVLKQEPYSVFKSKVAQHFSYPEGRIRLWTLANRRNKTVRPDMHIPENEPSLTVEVIRNDIAVQPGDLRLYLEVLPDPPKRIWLDHVGTIMIFLKHFNVVTQSLFGIGKIHMPRTNKVGDLVPIISERMGWGSWTALKLYEEVKPDMILLLKPQLTFLQSEFQDGDIICFQVDFSDEGVRNLESRGLCSNPEQFYKILQNRGPSTYDSWKITAQGLA